MGAVVITEGLSRRFGEMTAVDELDLSIQEGEVFGFLGPNGAGKTTTIRLLNGLLRPTGGRARVFDLDPALDGATVRQLTGVLTETPSLYENLSGRENLAFFGEVHGIPAQKLPSRIDELLETFGLAERGDDLVGTYSRGMKQRLAIARALLHEPPLLFLDEPTAALDPAAARMVTTLIEQLSHEGGRTIFLCTHNLTEAQRLCDRVGLINRGVLRALGTPAELADRLWKTLNLEILLQPSPDEAALCALRALPGTRQVDAQRNRLLVEVESREQIPDVVEMLVKHGLKIYGVIPQERTLEDIYFQLQVDNLEGGNHELASD